MVLEDEDDDEEGLDAPLSADAAPLGLELLPDFSMQSLGIAERDVYFDSSQRGSAWESFEELPFTAAASVFAFFSGTHGKRLRRRARKMPALTRRHGEKRETDQRQRGSYGARS